jgi:predicted lysophospholipase L1 biosynthesis ABC-type transport system permease subunit
VRTIDELIRNSTRDRARTERLLVLAAVVALLISTIGVYGVTAATTAARRRELAIRAAIGADRCRLSRWSSPGPDRRAIGVVAGLSRDRAPRACSSRCS